MILPSMQGISHQWLIENNYSVEFDGIDDYMTVTDADELSFGDASTDSPFSISAWVKANSWTNFRLVNKGVNTSNRELTFGGDASGGLFLYLFDLTSTVYIARGYNTTLNTGTWYHVACTYSGGGTPTDIKVYVDGSQVDNTSLVSGGYTAMHNTSSDLEVGTISFVPDYANGRIEELAIIGSELSAAQVSAIYNNGIPVSLFPYSPIGWWRMGDNDGATGTTITDQGSGANNGTLTNGPTFSTDIPVYRFNRKSVDFDGTDDYISIPDANELSFGDGSSDSAFSINVWVKFEVLQNARLVSKRLSSTTGREYQLSYQSDKIQFTLYDQSESWAYIYAENTANDLLAGVWYHIVATYDGSGSENGLTLYVNGLDVTTTRASFGAYTAMENGTSDVYIGSNGYDATYCVDGLIDEVAIIGSELSAARVSTIYGSEAPTSLSEYSPIGWWRMGDNDSATGTTITDQGSGGNNGTLTNGPTFSPIVPVYRYNRFSVDFDGVDDYVDCGDVAEINSASTITIQAWIKLDNTNNVFYIMSKYLDNNNRIHIGGASNVIYFNVSNGGGQYGSVSYTSTDWNHVALVFDGNLSGNANRLKAYINGVQQTLSFSGTIQSTLANLSGNSLQLFKQDSYYGDGKMDEAAVFTSALSAAQVSAIYNAGVPSDISSYSPVGWWRMGDNDGAMGTTITDQGSGGNNGTLTNGPTFSIDIPS